MALEDWAEALAPGQPIEKVASHYLAFVEAGLKTGALAREALWTESVAVGREAFVREISAEIDGRIKMTVESAGPNLWAVREEPGAYRPFSGPKTGSKGSESGISSS